MESNDVDKENDEDDDVISTNERTWTSMKFWRYVDGLLHDILKEARAQPTAERSQQFINKYVLLFFLLINA